MLWVLKAWRRRRALHRYGLPEAPWQAVLANLAVLRGLDQAEQQRLRELVILFLHEKSIETAGDLELSDTMRLRIAALACLPILNLGLDYYQGWVSVIVYPDTFLAPHEYVDAAGVVHAGSHPLMGEAWEQGPVILSWEDVVESTGNVVIHELAHKLDMLTGEVNGLPPLHPSMGIAIWSRLFAAAYADFCRRVEQGLEITIDPYAAEDPAEFFAVMSETFFTEPAVLRLAYPEIYGQLRDFYRQDPFLRLSVHERTF